MGKHALRVGRKQGLQPHLFDFVHGADIASEGDQVQTLALNRPGADIAPPQRGAGGPEAQRVGARIEVGLKRVAAQGHVLPFVEQAFGGLGGHRGLGFG